MATISIYTLELHESEAHCTTTENERVDEIPQGDVLYVSLSTSWAEKKWVNHMVINKSMYILMHQHWCRSPTKQKLQAEHWFSLKINPSRKIEFEHCKAVLQKHKTLSLYRNKYVLLVQTYKQMMGAIKKI